MSQTHWPIKLYLKACQDTHSTFDHNLKFLTGPLPTLFQDPSQSLAAILKRLTVWAMPFERSCKNKEMDWRTPFNTDTPADSVITQNRLTPEYSVRKRWDPNDISHLGPGLRRKSVTIIPLTVALVNWSTEHRLLARISYVYITMVVSLDRSFVLNSCNSQYSLLLSKLFSDLSLVARGYYLISVYILCYYRDNRYILVGKTGGNSRMVGKLMHRIVNTTKSAFYYHILMSSSTTLRSLRSFRYQLMKLSTPAV